MNDATGIGWLSIFLGVALGVFETYRTSPIAHASIVRLNNYLGTKTNIWIPVATVAIGVAAVLLRI